MTLAIALVSGLSGGFLCSLDFWKPVHALFRDDDNFVHMIEKYPTNYLENCDESVDYGKTALFNIKAILVANIPSNLTSDNQRKEWIITNIYKKFVHQDTELNKNQTLEFLNEFLEAEKLEDLAHEDGNVDYFTQGQLFNSMFKMLDVDKSGRVSSDEICGYFTKILGNEPTEGALAGDVEMQNFDKIE